MNRCRREFTEGFEAALQGDAALQALLPGGIQSNLAPEGLPFPRLVWQIVDATPAYTLGVLLSETFMVQCRIDMLGEDATPADRILARLDALLMDATFYVEGVELKYSRRAGDIPDGTEIEDNTVYQSTGATYEFVLGEA